MIKINDFLEKEFEITWTLLNLGYDKNSKFKNLIAGQDIIDFAINKIKDTAESIDIALLAGAHAMDAEEISELLKKMSDNEEADVNTEFRKWRVIYVLKNLPSIKTEYIQGLIELGDIWAALDFPDDSPHVFQGRNNCIAPSDYYTQKNYIKLLKKHRKWIEKEIDDLKGK
jgi:hypothetical protein